MVMLRSAGVAYKVAKKILGKQSIVVRNPKKNKEVNPKKVIQYLQH